MNDFVEKQTQSHEKPLIKTPQKLEESLKQHSEGTSNKTAEYIGIGESAEVAGEVSEVLGRPGENNIGSGIKGSTSASRRVAMTTAQIKAKLLKDAPSAEEMIRQVEKEIRKEIDYLHKRARKAVRSPGSFSAFEMNNIVKKIRELKSLLLILVKAAADTAKSLWLRFVHGVM